MSAPLSLEIFVGLLMFAAVFAPLERLSPLNRQRALRRGWLTDVAWYVIGCGVGRVSDALSLGGMLLIRHGLHLDSAGVAGGQPQWLQFIEILLIADFLGYWYHRALHRVPMLWRLHRVHHSSQHMDWLANVRLHPLDKVLGDCFQFIPIFLLGFSSQAILAYTVFLGFQSFLNHANLKVDFGPLRWIVANPSFHHWHHSNDPKFYDKNFAPHLVIFDRLFGTAHIPADLAPPEHYGVTEPVPEDLWGQMLSPFRGLGWTGDARRDSR